MIGDNIKKLRDEQGLTQTQFAKKIGVSQGTIASAESNSRNLSVQLLTSICREFKVRMEWLKTGEGEMYETRDISILEQLKKEYSLSPKSLELIENFLKLPPATRDLVATAVEQAALQYSRKSDNELTPDEAAEVIRRERQDVLDAQKRGTSTLLVSTGTNGSLKKSGSYLE